MAFRIPFNEHLTIEADTPADVRGLIAEFGVSIGMKQLPPPARVVDAEPLREKPRRASVARTKASTRLQPQGETTALQTQLLEHLAAKGPTSTGLLSAAVAADRTPVKRALELLASKGLVHSTGATITQRWNLGAKGSSSPKEAESRR